VWHCYVKAGRWVRLVHSASLFRAAAEKAQQNLTSRANRYLHWLDMFRFGESGIDTYDFGGWYSGQEDQEKLRINQFKEGFGGTVASQYNGDRGITLKGILALRLRHASDVFRGKR
jgi:hypothetical protein